MWNDNERFSAEMQYIAKSSLYDLLVHNIMQYPTELVAGFKTRP